MNNPALGEWELGYIRNKTLSTLQAMRRGGILSVWSLNLDKVKKEKDQIEVSGTFYGDYAETDKHTFTIIFDKDYGIISADIR